METLRALGESAIAIGVIVCAMKLFLCAVRGNSQMIRAPKAVITDDDTEPSGSFFVRPGGGHDPVRVVDTEGGEMSDHPGRAIRTSIYVVEMPDGSHWGVPVEVIARNRAEYFAPQYGHDISRSLNESTWPLFEQDTYEVADWARSNMNWLDVERVACIVKDAPVSIDWETGWNTGTASVRPCEKCPGHFADAARGAVPL